MKKTTFSFYLIIIISLLSNISANSQDKILLSDNFSKLDTGLVIPPGIGPHAEYHFLKSLMPKGNWSVTCFQSREADHAWSVKVVDGAKVMEQTYNRTIDFSHPTIDAGNIFWGDYKAEVTMSPLALEGRTGLLFRLHNDRCYYFYGMYNQKIVILKLNHGVSYRKENRQVLAEQEYPWKLNQKYTLAVEVVGNTYTASLNGKKIFTVKDDLFARGKIGLTSDKPARFYSVKVTTNASEAERIAKETNAQSMEWADLQTKNPKLKLWKKIDIKGFGTWRNVRFGDLNGDGQIDVLIGQVEDHSLPYNSFVELSCLTAITLDGKILWQTGTPKKIPHELANDVAFQIYDIDGDGKNEVIYTMGCKLIIADGATGKIKKSVPTPERREEQTDRITKKVVKVWDRILGDCLFICDLRGLGRPQDLVIKDRYENFWVLDEKLNVRWTAKCTTGHYPYARDIDGDGKDELFIGYSMYKDSPKAIYSWDSTIKDHNDGVAAVNFRATPDSKIEVMSAASDEGMIFANTKGDILKHYYVGHVQNPVIANFRDDLPGLETVTVNFWGNQGIFHFLDANHNIYYDMEPVNYGSMCLPVNWTGKSEEFFIISANIKQGGMFDGWGRKVVSFPDDGHPDLCNAVLNLTGDVRDEVVVWNETDLWVYTQDDSPKKGKLYNPVRNQLFNESNYKVSVSEPGWSK